MSIDKLWFVKSTTFKLERLKFFYDQLNLREFEYVIPQQGINDIGICPKVKDMKEIMDAFDEFLKILPNDSLAYYNELIRVCSLLCIDDVKKTVERYAVKKKLGSTYLFFKHLIDMIDDTYEYICRNPQLPNYVYFEAN